MPNEQDLYYLNLALESGKRLSQHPDQYQGAVIVSKVGRLISEGASRVQFGFAERYEGRPQEERKIIGIQWPARFSPIISAGEDAIYEAIRKGEGHLLEEATLYSTEPPKIELANIVMGTRIKRVAIPEQTKYSMSFSDLEQESFRDIISLFYKANIDFDLVDFPEFYQRKRV